MEGNCCSHSLAEIIKTPWLVNRGSGRLAARVCEKHCGDGQFCEVTASLEGLLGHVPSIELSEGCSSSLKGLQAKAELV